MKVSKGVPPAIPFVLRGRGVCVHANGRVGQVHMDLRLGLFPLGASRAKGRAPTNTEATEI